MGREQVSSHTHSTNRGLCFAVSDWLVNSDPAVCLISLSSRSLRIQRNHRRCRPCTDLALQNLPLLQPQPLNLIDSGVVRRREALSGKGWPVRGEKEASAHIESCQRTELAASRDASRPLDIGLVKRLLFSSTPASYTLVDTGESRRVWRGCPALACSAGQGVGAENAEG